MIRLIATDVDGTIAADGSCEINPEYYTVIRKLRALGIQVAAGQRPSERQPAGSVRAGEGEDLLYQQQWSRAGMLES